MAQKRKVGHVPFGKKSKQKMHKEKSVLWPKLWSTYEKIFGFSLNIFFLSISIPKLYSLIAYRIKT